MKALAILLAALACPSFGQTSLVNFQHLRHLTERIAFTGDSVDIIHVYAEYPNYEWVDAKESGPEGIACVDDAARAAVVYLRHYELTKNAESAERAKRLLKFVTKMQADDGQFYNFIFADRSINTDGKTSFKSFGWWAARAVWCMATGFRVFRDVDTSFADELRLRVVRTFPHVEHMLARYDSVRIIQGYRVPQWLLYESAADATSELLLGLNEYYTATRDERCRHFIRRLARGLIVMQDGDITNFPFGLHRSWQTMWHMWGNGQTQALAQAGALLRDKNMIGSAEREAQGFYSRLLIQGFVKEIDVAAPEHTIRYEQIAYGVRPMAVGLIRLYEATKKREYLTMAGLAASWFFGNNAAQKPMYDPTTGRCFDGIQDSLTVNLNSGAESTIEALYTLFEVERYPDAVHYVHYRRVGSGENERYLWGTFADTSGSEVTLALDRKQARLMVLEGRNSKAFRQRMQRP